jgi:hypothetical protein
VESQKSESFSPYVDEKGGISLPADFREKWTYLGVWLLHESKGMMHKGIHEVFTQPGVVEAYKRNDNKFPGGTVLIKEVRSTKSANMTTGKDVISVDKEILWFVMIKDKKGRFPDNPKWGEGWGWALYYASDPSKDVSTDYKKDCIGCHIPAKSTDWVYVNGYPALK